VRAGIMRAGNADASQDNATFLKPGVSVHFSFSKANMGVSVGKQVGDRPWSSSRRRCERAICLAEVERLYLDEAPHAQGVVKSSAPCRNRSSHHSAHEHLDLFESV